MPPMSARPRKSSVFLAVFALLLAAMPALLASNAHAASPTKAKTWNVMVGAESSSGAVQTMAYGPKKIWINAGDTVHWVANSMEPHTVSFVDDKLKSVQDEIARLTGVSNRDDISGPGAPDGSQDRARAHRRRMPAAVGQHRHVAQRANRHGRAAVVSPDAGQGARRFVNRRQATARELFHEAVLGAIVAGHIALTVTGRHDVCVDDPRMLRGLATRAANCQSE